MERIQFRRHLADRGSYEGAMRIALLIILFCASAIADSIVPEERIATNQWAQWCGVKGGIDSGRTNFFTFGPTATVAQINSKISSAPSNSFIFFEAGIYSLSDAISLDGKNGVTLRGTNTWPPSVIFSWTDTTASSYLHILNPYHEGADAAIKTTSWTAGYSRGSTNMTVSSTNSMKPGQVLALDQLNDELNGETAYGGEGQCGTCDTQLDGLHVKQQHVQLMRLVDATHIEVEPPIFGTNWTSGKSPRVLFTSDQSGGAGCGIENIFLTCTNDTHVRPRRIFYARWVTDPYVQNCYFYAKTNVISTSWSANVNFGIELANCVRGEVRGTTFDSVGRHGSESYSVALYGGSSYLVTDNIGSPFTSFILTAGGVEGSVISYNFCTNSQFENVSSVAIASSVGFHGGYANYILVEGNWFQHMDQDDIHGSSGFITYLRNRSEGYQTNMTAETVALEIAGSNYFNNAICNILGTSGYTTNYMSTNDVTSPSKNRSAFKLNFWDAASAGVDHDDVLVMTTFIQKANYNTSINQPGIPSVESVGSTNIASSYYLSSKPSSFGGLSWPAVDSASPSTLNATNVNAAGYRWAFGTNPPASFAGGGSGATATPGPGKPRSRRVAF